jgi:hypothetical protein
MRPLTVSTLYSPRPLFRLHRPVAGLFGGGESGFRRVDPHLHALLKGLAPQLAEQVADPLLGTGDDLARWGRIDGVGHTAEGLLDAAAH